MIIEDIYPTFNARHLQPREVAESFIWSENYGALIQNNHTVVLGARGCGKTTLMKMLTLPALHSWKDSRAESIRKNIPFYGVYISTDIYWDVKNQTYNSQLKQFGNFAEIVSIFSVNSNVFTSLCDTFLNILKYEISDNDDDKESELCKSLMEAWRIKNVIPKLHFIKEALNKRIDEVNQLIQNVIFNFKTSDSIPHYDYFNLHFETSIELIIPIFERIYGIENKRKWALCFDELEFAPLWLQEKLFKSLRSRTQYILYKLSASPILSIELEKLLQNNYRATAGNDVQIIKMWTTDNETFSKQIIESLLFKKFQVKDVVSFFGSNEIYNKSTGSYQKDSNFYQQLMELLSKDNAFKFFLKSKKVDIETISFDDNEKDTLFRKIKPIVYFRNFYISENKTLNTRNPEIKYRSRKSSELLFSGIEVLTKICDGNPRWLIGIISAILSKATASGVNGKIQYDELFSAAKRFKNVIANIPVGDNLSLPLIEIIDKIGNYFKEEVLGKEFKMDPKGTFIVDGNKSNIPNNIIKLLEKGISQGAIILLGANDDSFDFEIRNQRFRLCYLFSLLYSLPIRSYPEIKLSECLTQSKNNNQISLFE